MARIFAQSATPYRKESLKHIADRLVRPVAYNDLVREGYLVKPVTYAPISLDMSNVRVTGGEYDKRDLYKIYSRTAVIEDIVRNYKLYAPGLRSILFAPSQSVAKKMCDILNEHDIPAAYADDSTPIEERQELIRKLVNREILVICNVQIFAVGVNIPQLEAVIVTRPTLSLALHIQMLGRGSRPHPDKKTFVILDMAGNCERHSLLQHAPIGWIDKKEDDESDKKSKPSAKTMTCPNCKSVFVKRAKPNFCQACGWIEEIKKKKKPRTKLEIMTDIHDLCEINEHKRTVFELIEIASKREEKGSKPGSVYFESKKTHGHEEASVYCPPELKDRLYEIYSKNRRKLRIPEEAFENYKEFESYLKSFE